MAADIFANAATSPPSLRPERRGVDGACPLGSSLAGRARMPGPGRSRRGRNGVMATPAGSVRLRSGFRCRTGRSRSGRSEGAAARETRSACGSVKRIRNSMPIGSSTISRASISDGDWIMPSVRLKPTRKVFKILRRRHHHRIG